MAKKVASANVPAATPAPAATAPVKKVPVKKAAPAAAAATTTAPVKAAPVKKAAPAPAAAPAKKVPPKKAPSLTADGLTLRAAVFGMLNGAADGMTGSAIMEKLGKAGEPAYTFIKDEGCSDAPRIARVTQEGVRGAVYKLTAAGKAAVKAGTVDSEAAPMSTGKTWPA